MDIFSLITVMSFFTLGYTPTNNELLTDTTFQRLIYTDFGIEASCKGFMIGGNIKTTIAPVSIISYKPVQEYYTFELGYKYKLRNNYLMLNYLHECQHVVSASNYTLGLHKDRNIDRVTLNFDALFDRWIFKYHFNIGGGCLLRSAESLILMTKSKKVFGYCKKEYIPYVNVETKFSYKNIYIKIGSELALNFDYQFYQEYGVNFKISNADLSIGFKKTNRDHMSIDYFDAKNRFNSKDRIEFFLTVIKY